MGMYVSAPSRSVREGQAASGMLGKTISLEISGSLVSPSLRMKPPSVSNTGTKVDNLPGSSCTIRAQLIPQNVTPEFQTDTLRAPAVEVMWEGNFEVQNISSNDKIFKDFVAHPSVNIRHKAFEFCTQLPHVMQFNIHPRHAFWPHRFQIDRPDGGDIALYFYPDNEGSQRRYASLLKYLHEEDLMLRSHMGDVELLIFPSKVLAVDCQRWGGHYFMWGVFRKLKDGKACGTVDAPQGVPYGDQHNQTRKRFFGKVYVRRRK